MSVAVRTTAVGVFYDHDKAEKAVEELTQAGFTADHIGVAVRHSKTADPPQEHATKAEEGGVAGVITGGVLGGLLGAGVVAAGFIPGLGQVLWIGVLAGVLSGVAGGAVAGGLVGALIGMGIPEEEARYYQSELEAGRTIVTVKAGDQYDKAVDILRRWGAYGKGSPLI
ncbi:MAG: general stress protein [Planctomycetes bacterium]|nr:general stress protein [Planctomycetota bacterium]